MTDPNPLNDTEGTPEDVATLYSWANLHGAKYRDFSAARAQTREKARLRAEQALAEQALTEPALQAKPTLPTTHQDELYHGLGEADAACDADALGAEPRLQIEAEHPAPEHPALEHPVMEPFLLGVVGPLETDEEAHSSMIAAEQAVHEQAAHEAEVRAAERARFEAQLDSNRFVELSQGHATAIGESAQLAAEQVAERAAQQAAWHGEEEARIEAARQEEQGQTEYAARRGAELTAQLEAQQAAEAAARLEAERTAQRTAQDEAERLAAQEADRQAVLEAERLAAREAEERAAHLAAERAQAAHLAEQQALRRAAEQAAAHLAELRVADHVAEHAAQQRVWQQPRVDRSPAQPAYEAHNPSAQEERSMPPRNPWATPEMPETNGKPAWLSEERSEVSSETAGHSPMTAAPLTSAPLPPASMPPASEDTLQGSRDRLTSRWFALRGIFESAPPPAEPPPAPVVSRAPAMALFSLAGGVGKTSLVATLGRALSARGERVLLVDTAAFGLLPFFFGATDQRPGLLRTFNPPGFSSDAPIQMVTLDPEGLSSNGSGGDSSASDALTGEIAKLSRGLSRVIVDLATASGATTRRIIRLAPLVLVPVIPDMNSVVSVSSIDAFFEHNSNPGGKPAMPFYVLNQFDASLPLHLDVREVLREQLAERLLPFALRRTPAMSEALAEGMTVMDYAPSSVLAEDFVTLASWVKSLSAPATTSYRGVRWSER